MDVDAYSRLLRRVSALERRLAALFRTGRVARVQLAPYRVAVDVGPDTEGAPVVTDLLPVAVPRAGETRDWTPLTLGERVSVISPGGEDVSAFVWPAHSSDDFPAAGDSADIEVRRYGAHGDAGVEVARIAVSRGADAASSTMTLACGRSSIELAGNGDMTLRGDDIAYRAPL